jgi:hypothetical protein
VIGSGRHSNKTPLPDCHARSPGRRLGLLPHRLWITPSAGRSSPIREGIIKDCASGNPDIVVGNSCPAIAAAIETARSPLRWVPTATSAAGRRAPVRSTPVSHLHQSAVRWTRNSLSCIRSRQSRMRCNWYYQRQRPDQGQSEDAQFSLLPQSGFRHPAHNGFAATFRPAGRDCRCEIGKDGMAVEHVGDV